MPALRTHFNSVLNLQVLYRFADLDPFTRCSYFGRSLDLGQFERMRRLMRMSFHSTLLGHDEAQVRPGCNSAHDSG